jgi:hypothetical protein
MDFEVGVHLVVVGSQRIIYEERFFIVIQIIALFDEMIEMFRKPILNTKLSTALDARSVDLSGRK